MAKEKDADMFFFQANPPCQLDPGRIEVLRRDLFNNKFKVFGQEFFRGWIVPHGSGRKSKDYEAPRPSR